MDAGGAWAPGADGRDVMPFPLWPDADPAGFDGAGGEASAAAGARRRSTVVPVRHRKLLEDEARLGPVDEAAVERAARDLIGALGYDVGAPGLAETPRRIAQAFAELLTPEAFEPTSFENTSGYRGLVVVRDVPFTSLCEHHLLPFSGYAHLAYLPEGSVLGLSKLARAVELFARRLQLQERLTEQLAEWLMASGSARGSAVVVEAEHQCMSIRGARASGSLTVTEALRGELEDGSWGEELRVRLAVRGG